MTCVNLQTPNGWVPGQVDISAYRGMKVELIFQTVTNSVDWSNFFLDTISIN